MEYGGTNNPSRGPEYYEVPQLKTSDYLISNTEIDNNTRTWFSQYQSNDFEMLTLSTIVSRKPQREVNYLVKEFECKKSARLIPSFFYISYWCSGLFQTSHLQVQRRSLQEGQCCS